jgi:hypothetical protein
MTAPNDNTPISIIQDAYLDAGLIQEGESPGSDKLVLGLRRLQDIINLWQTQGLKLWLDFDYELVLVAGQASYTFSPTGNVVMPKPPRALAAYYEDSSGVRRPLTPLARDDYNTLGILSQQGEINSFYVDKQATVLTVYFWLVPDATAATGSVFLTLQRQITNPILLTETMNFPIEWRIALRWGLADELSVGQPAAIMERCANNAARYRMMLEDWDVEDASVYFTADSRSGAFPSRFR